MGQRFTCNAYTVCGEKKTPLQNLQYLQNCVMFFVWKFQGLLRRKCAANGTSFVQYYNSLRKWHDFRLLAHSKNELIQWRGVRRLSVRPSVCLSVNFCANRFFSQANGRIATKLAHDGLRVSLHPGCAQGQGQGQGLRSRDTRTFLDSWNELLRHWRSG